MIMTDDNGVGTVNVQATMSLSQDRVNIIDTDTPWTPVSTDSWMHQHKYDASHETRIIIVMQRCHNYITVIKGTG
jgi:hypothetical protein